MSNSISAEMMKIHLANLMADYRMKTDPNGQPRIFWVDYYYEMRDFDLLNLWLDKCGDKMLTDLKLINLN
jgi:hypothetical protein